MGTNSVSFRQPRLITPVMDFFKVVTRDRWGQNVVFNMTQSVTGMQVTPAIKLIDIKVMTFLYSCHFSRVNKASPLPVNHNKHVKQKNKNSNHYFH